MVFWQPKLQSSYLFSNFFIIYLFLRDRETEHERERGREKKMQNLKQADSSEPDVGLELTNREFMTRAELGRLTDWVTQTPHNYSYANTIIKWSEEGAR